MVNAPIYTRGGIFIRNSHLFNCHAPVWKSVFPDVWVFCLVFPMLSSRFYDVKWSEWSGQLSVSVKNETLKSSVIDRKTRKCNWQKKPKIKSIGGPVCFTNTRVETRCCKILKWPQFTASLTKFLIFEVSRKMLKSAQNSCCLGIIIFKKWCYWFIAATKSKDFF